MTEGPRIHSPKPGAGILHAAPCHPNFVQKRCVALLLRGGRDPGGGHVVQLIGFASAGLRLILSFGGSMAYGPPGLLIRTKRSPPAALEWWRSTRSRRRFPDGKILKNILLVQDLVPTVENKLNPVSGGENRDQQTSGRSISHHPSRFRTREIAGGDNRASALMARCTLAEEHANLTTLKVIEINC